MAIESGAAERRRRACAGASVDVGAAQHGPFRGSRPAHVPITLASHVGQSLWRQANRHGCTSTARAMGIVPCCSADKFGPNHHCHPCRVCRRRIEIETEDSRCPFQIPRSLRRGHPCHPLADRAADPAGLAPGPLRPRPGRGDPPSDRGRTGRTGDADRHAVFRAQDHGRGRSAGVGPAPALGLGAAAPRAGQRGPQDRSPGGGNRALPSLRAADRRAGDGLDPPCRHRGLRPDPLAFRAVPALRAAKRNRRGPLHHAALGAGLGPGGGAGAAYRRRAETPCDRPGRHPAPDAARRCRGRQRGPARPRPARRGRPGAAAGRGRRRHRPAPLCPRGRRQRPGARASRPPKAATGR